MLPKYHFIIGLIVSTLVYFIFPEINQIYLGLFFISYFLIDFDHYLFYVYKYKEYNLNKSYKFFRKNSRFFKHLPKKEKRKYTSGIFVFHGFETILIAILLGLFWEGFYFIGLGVALHLILDYIEKIRSFHPPYKISIICDLIKNKSYKKVPTNFKNKFSL